MSENRNYGVDLLRMILMICIVIGHLYAHTEIRSILPFLGGKWLFTWSTQAVTVCAVNCFVIITGYYMSQSHYDLFKVIKLWLKVVFYSIFVTVILLVLRRLTFNARSILDTVFPVLSREYWFFTMYILLYLLIPYLNAGLTKMPKKMHGALVIIILCFFYIEPLLSVVFYEYDVTEGFSLVAFVTLYVIGAYLAKCRDIQWRHCVCMLIGSSLLMVSSKIVLEMIVNRYGLNFGTALLYHNNSIFVLINAIALFELFKQVNIKQGVKKAVAWISPSVFSVYLLHEKPAIRKIIWGEQLVVLLRKIDFVGYCLIVVGIGIGIFTIGIMIDKFFTWTLFGVMERTGIAGKVKEYCQRYNESIDL